MSFINTTIYDNNDNDTKSKKTIPLLKKVTSRKGTPYETLSQLPRGIT